MNYKAIIKSPEKRYAILRALSWIPDKSMIRLQYRIKQGFWPNLKNPKRFTEWLQWYKLNYRNPVMQQCVDKAEVRKYIENKGLQDILIPLIGIYDDVKDIKPEILPEKFVMKTTSGGGGLNVILCRDKSKLDFNQSFRNLNKWLTSKSTEGGREWAYLGIKKPRVIIEELLEQPDGSDLCDYKIMCFNGTPQIIVLDKDRYTNHHRNFYTAGWDYIDVISDHENCGDIYPRPVHFDKMLDLAAKLSEDFPFVRVDLYNINGKIYFGELTFYPWSGYVKFSPDEFDFTLGKMFAFHRSCK